MQSDAYFEYRLVGEQIFELTGNRTLLDVEDPNAQMQRLYDNAVEQQGPLGLVLGKPLTPQQIAEIKKDMIWLEIHLVDGQEVLVPHVYLAPTSSSEQGIKNGTRIARKPCQCAFEREWGHLECGPSYQ